MVAKAKQSQSTIVSESEDGSGGHDSCTEQVTGGAPSSVFPRRLFAADSYPTGLRVNIYSKANVIGSIAASLWGSPAMDTFLASQFCRLFELPVVCCHNSTKLIGSLLCRQLVTVRTNELWFTFATHPLCFSLDEFRDVTGLNCGAFDGFLAYPWGRASFLVTLQRFLPPPASEILFAFEAVPLLLEKIPDAANTANFLDEPTACAGSVTILTVNDIVAVKQDPALSVHFTVIPDAERLMLVDEAEDSQVTSLVQKLLCGETFKTEDFPGGDRSFCPKLEVRDAGQEEKGCPIPIHQRNLRPRKAVSVEVEEVSSSGNSEEGNPPCSETCTHENLKRWMSERFEKLENMFEELHTVVCRSFGMPEGSNHNTRKRKASDDPQFRQTAFPDIIGIQTEGPNRKGKKRKTVVTRRDQKKTLCPRRSGGGNDVSMVVHRRHQKKQPNFIAEIEWEYKDVVQETRTPRPREDDQPKANESDNGRLPRPGENKGDQIPSTFQYEVGSPIASEKTTLTVTGTIQGRRARISCKIAREDGSIDVHSSYSFCQNWSG
ncbi:hypothetical protein Bca4012_026806 [Brassica carinata]